MTYKNPDYLKKKVEGAMKEQFRDEYYKRNKIKVNQEPNKLEKIVELHQQGLINKDIAEKLDIASITVTTYLRKVNLKRNFSERQYKIMEQVLELNQQGYANADIEKQLDVSYQTVTRYLINAGLRC